MIRFSEHHDIQQMFHQWGIVRRSSGQTGDAYGHNGCEQTYCILFCKLYSVGYMRLLCQANKLSSYSNQPYTIKKTIIFYYFFTLMITVICYSMT